MKNIFSIIVLMTLSLNLYATSNDLNKGKPMNPDSLNNKGHYIISAPIVIKGNDFYLSRSIQDYFIKLCESKVGRQALIDRIGNIDELFNTVTLEVEFRNGALDNCENNHMTPNNTGKYIIIHSIINDDRLRD